MESEAIAKMEVFPKYTSLDAEDYFGGTYKNVPLNMREMETRLRVRKKSTHCI